MDFLLELKVVASKLYSCTTITGISYLVNEILYDLSPVKHCGTVKRRHLLYVT